MVDAITNAVTQASMEIVILLIGALGTYITRKLTPMLDRTKKLREVEIINKITDDVVQFVESEFTGIKGADKRRMAATRVASILQTKGINVSEMEILAGIENGVRKLKR